MSVRRWLTAALVLAGLAAVVRFSETGEGPAAADASAVSHTPRLLVLRQGYRNGSAVVYDLLTTGPNGGSRHLLYGVSGGDPVIPQDVLFAGMSWSADGRRLVFGGARRLRPEGGEPGDLYLLPAAGGKARRLTRLRHAYAPLLSPNGRWIAFVRTRGTARRSPAFSVWRIDVDGSGLRRLTRWRRGLLVDIPGSFSPSGKELAYTRVDCRHSLGCHYSIRTLGLRGSVSRLLARNAQAPSFSPDGEQIAFASSRDNNGKIPTGEDEAEQATELYVMNADRSGRRRLTRTRDISETSPSWDPSGKRIAYSVGESRFESSIAEINRNGTCRRIILHGATRHTATPTFLMPTWRPGPGRGAGPIVC